MRQGARMKTIGLIVPLLLVSAVALSGGAHANPGDGTTDPTIDVAIDVDTTGNGDNVLGPTESCNETPLEVGDTIDLDIVVRGIPEYDQISDRGGIRGTDFDLLFNPSVVRVNQIQGFEGPTILKAGGGEEPFEQFDLIGPPGTTGDVFGGMVDLSAVPRFGDGVLTRVTLQAVGEGFSHLDLRYLLKDEDFPQIYGADFNVSAYPVHESDATIVVGNGSCDPPTPSAVPFITPSPTPTATPVGFAKVRFEPEQIAVGEDTTVLVKAFSIGPPIESYEIVLNLDSAITIVGCTATEHCHFDQASNVLSISAENQKSTPGTIGSFFVRATGESGDGIEADSVSMHDIRGLTVITDLPIGRPLLKIVARATPTPTIVATTHFPTPGTDSSTVTPAALPRAGGAPRGVSYWLIGGATALFVAAAATAVLAYTRRRL